MRTSLVLGNWKMNGSRVANATLVSDLLQSGIDSIGVEVGVAVPSVYLEQVGALIKDTPVRLGGQDVSMFTSGAYTGEVSGSMLSDLSASFTLIGHSERRAYHGETDDHVLAKVVTATTSELEAVVCIGETLQQYEAGQTEDVLARQLKLLCEQLTIQQWQRVVIAYEPVWAIGTGKVASPEYAQKVHKFIREMIANVDLERAKTIKILYGGSVKAENAAQLRAMPDIDGALVGGASLVAEQFLGICRNFR